MEIPCRRIALQFGTRNRRATSLCAEDLIFPVDERAPSLLELKSRTLQVECAPGSSILPFMRTHSGRCGHAAPEHAPEKIAIPRASCGHLEGRSRGRLPGRSIQRPARHPRRGAPAWRLVPSEGPSGRSRSRMFSDEARPDSSHRAFSTVCV